MRNHFTTVRRAKAVAGVADPGLMRQWLEPIADDPGYNNVVNGSSSTPADSAPQRKKVGARTRLNFWIRRSARR
jgi:hypothetical protein